MYSKEGGERSFFRVGKARVLWRETSWVLRVDGDIRMSMADLEGVFCGVIILGLSHLIVPTINEVIAAAALERTKNARMNKLTSMKEQYDQEGCSISLLNHNWEAIYDRRSLCA